MGKTLKNCHNIVLVIHLFFWTLADQLIPGKLFFFLFYIGKLIGTPHWVILQDKRINIKELKVFLLHLFYSQIDLLKELFNPKNISYEKKITEKE